MSGFSMKNWSGFSQEDIVKMKNEKDPTKEGYIKIENPHKGQLKNNKTAKKPGRCSILEKNLNANPSIPQYPISQEAKLSQVNKSSSMLDSCSNSSVETSTSSLSVRSQTPSDETSPTKFSGTQAKTVTILIGEDKSYKVVSSAPNDNLLGKPASNEDNQQQIREHAYLLDKENSIFDDYHEQGKTSLAHFQERQKMMEEQNKRKKDLLTKALADRKRQTQFEAKKLLQIQEELSRLDALLSTDVGILRDQIELASYEFNEAQKRYDRAESEFIEAKLHLFSKLERKELLTEHLCRIIEVNEQRKAKKLSQLMAKLEISDEHPPNEEEFNQQVFSLGANVDEVTYSACNTVKNPNSKNAVTKDQTISVIESSTKSEPGSDIIPNKSNSSGPEAPNIISHVECEPLEKETLLSIDNDNKLQKGNNQSTND